jgi:hypothetical protein
MRLLYPDAGSLAPGHVGSRLQPGLGRATFLIPVRPQHVAVTGDYRPGLVGEQARSLEQGGLCPPAAGGAESPL